MAAMLARREREMLLQKRSKSSGPSSRTAPVFNRYQPTLSEPLIPDMIIPNLYLTDMFTARGVLMPSFAGHGRPNIKYVLSVLDNSISQPKPKEVNKDKFVQKLIILDDTMDADLLMKLADGCDFIEECLARDDGGVMVHCQLGQSRSASMVIAYIMRKQGLEYQKALEKVKYKRGIVRPNPGFVAQLQLWAEMNCSIFSSGLDGEGQMRKKQVYTLWKEEQKRRVERVMNI